MIKGESLPGLDRVGVGKRLTCPPFIRPGYAIYVDHLGNTSDTNCLFAWHARNMEGVWQFILTGKNVGINLGSIVRVGDCIPVSDFYLVLHVIRC